MTTLDPDSLLDELAAQLRECLGEALENCVMMGIHTGGLWVAERLHSELGLATALCSLNINFYRDDFSRIGLHPRVEPSRITEPLEGRCVILVDDVLYTGRTVRAAMNEIFDHGRPAAVKLAVLVDRGGRELPISPDFVAHRLELPDNQQVELTGPEPLSLQILAGE